MVPGAAPAWDDGVCDDTITESVEAAGRGGGAGCGGGTDQAACSRVLRHLPPGQELLTVILARLRALPALH